MKLADLTKEIEALKSLRHERLIRLHAVCSVGAPVYIVTELMRKGNLRAYLGSEYPAAPRCSLASSHRGQQPAPGPGGVSGPAYATCGPGCTYLPSDLQPTRPGLWVLGRAWFRCSQGLMIPGLQ